MKVADPYRWLEADVRESPEVAEWVRKQNEVARKYLDAIPQRPQIERRLTELWNYERYSAPTVEGRQVLLSEERRPAESVGAVRRRHVRRPRAACCSTRTRGRRTARSRWPTSPPATTASSWPMPAPTPAATGSRFIVVDVATGKQQPDHLKWARFSDIAWAQRRQRLLLQPLSRARSRASSSSRSPRTR